MSTTGHPPFLLFLHVAFFNPHDTTPFFMHYRKLGNLTGWLVFGITFLVYFFSVERTGSLWDCGEFVSGAYKLQVVHPPGAPMFLIVGRMFTWVAEMFSSNPSDIAFSVNLLSGICSAFAATFAAWMAFMMGKLALVGRSEEVSRDQAIALAGGGLVAGLATAFSTSIWFSAVEGEVYAMSTFFTALTAWAAVRWYAAPKEDADQDRWLIFSFYAAGLSVGVHLLSLLVFPFIALLYYFKKNEEYSFKGMTLAVAAGLGFLFFTQSLVIIGIPNLWGGFERFMVNSLGMPQHTGIIPTLLLISAAVFFALRYAHANKHGFLQKLVIACTMIVIGFSTIGVVVIRANAGPPINMNEPDNVMRLVPYLNREQYGDRPLLRGPHFDADITGTESSDKYDYVDDAGRYEVVDRRLSYTYNDNDKMLFPRMADGTQGRPDIYRRDWMNGKQGPPSMGDNLSFFVRYQLGWMYWRYFMWNFAGRQNADQGYHPRDVSRGNWLSGITPLDEMRLHNMSQLPEDVRTEESRNKYFLLPFLFGLLGMVFSYTKRREDFIALLALFLVTGIGIIVQSNQPPQEPRERDYVLVGSFITFCIWMGMAVPALYEIIRERFKAGAGIAAPLAAALVLIAPVLMGTQNYDDHSRRTHEAARDYAANFLHSCEPNAILFTYGDNDTYPLWYAQEVEGIRTDVRVVNLSLIAVDWYINQLRRKVNDSEAIKLTIPEEAYRGYRRNQVPIDPFQRSGDRIMDAKEALKFVAEDHSSEFGGRLESYLPARKLSIPVDRQAAIETGAILSTDSVLVPEIIIDLDKNNMFKGDLAVLDILASNLWERPIYFAVTSRRAALLGLGRYTALEGLALRITPVINPTDDSRRMGLVGLGRVNTDKAHNLITNMWKWGNFDTHKTFVDNSYRPSVQSMQLSMMRAADAYLRAGEKQKAEEIADAYFQAFPLMNFSYGFSTISMIDLYGKTGAIEKAKERTRELAEYLADWLPFYYSLSPDDLEGSFRQDYSMAEGTRQNLLNIARGLEDQEFDQEINAILGPFDPAGAGQ
jgi:VanZ family protein